MVLCHTDSTDPADRTNKNINVFLGDECLQEQNEADPNHDNYWEETPDKCHGSGGWCPAPYKYRY